MMNHKHCRGGLAVKFAERPRYACLSANLTAEFMHQLPGGANLFLRNKCSLVMK